jgi:hypothetical protein
MYVCLHPFIPVTPAQAEYARLEAALSAQQRSLSDLNALVSAARLSEDGNSLLLDMAGGRVRVRVRVCACV